MHERKNIKGKGRDSSGAVFPGLIRLIVSLVLLFGLTGPVKAGDFSLDGSKVVDQTGHTLQIDTPFERIISLYGAHTENLFFLGLDQQIIGVGRNDHYPPQAESKPSFSYHDGPEKFLATRPDLVLIRPMISRGYPDLVERLLKSDIEVLSLQPSNPEEMFTYWNILGVVSGKGAEAQAMVDEFQKAVARYQALTDPIPDKKRVYFEAIHSRMKTFSQGAMALFVLEAAGGINVAQEARPSRGTNIAHYGKERILAQARNIDVYLAQKGPMNSITKAAIQQEPGFHLIRAVQNGAIHIVDETIVSRPTFRLLKGIQEIGSLLYPDLFEQAGQEILDQAYGRKR